MMYLYEFSIAAQLSGAIILLIWCFSKVSKNVLDMCVPSVVFANRKESGEAYIDRHIIQQKVKTIFLNMWAFTLICAGYLTNVFSENNMDEPWKKLILIVIMTSVLLFIANSVSQYMSMAWGKEDRILTEEEIEKYNIPTEVSAQEIENLFVER